MAAPKKVDREEFQRLAPTHTNKQLKEHFNVNEATISRLRKLTNTSTAVRLTPERKARIQKMIDDGWPFKEIQRTEGADISTLRRHFPGHQWTPQQAQEHTSAIRPIFRRIRRAERFAAMGRTHGNAA